ncbi:NADPH-dependent 2,4-dienoyl-CoA reductase/sulfur reductase-like enzyme [Sphingobium subterraneum]|uniref:NADPH-dependent 2,4-dienoyl-CoA reductase/sulfur reductase-like enzyme n=2 Tax=Sphingobium subterraneum TaxID=627688 RepID=A0A841J4B5_9SPHN|nr:FAD-dependent oxidoreductase [Sphingobium subterraneum]MBB6123091.1 NADPH-dependent 2,4-dienoyl-CoA reductase/sulfur reductase-like enzyme [Sphingobium subterraneum]
MGNVRAGALVIGAGQAGARAARAMRMADFDGPIRIIGAEPHFPYERPLLSKALLQDPDGPLPWVLAEDQYRELAIELIVGVPVTEIDRSQRTLRLANETLLPYDTLLIATGSVLRPIELGHFPTERIFSLRTLEDSRAIAARLGNGIRVAVVGGGFVGLETAATMRKRGCEVVVVELADRLLPRLACTEASELVLRHHRTSGIDVRLGTRVVGGGEGFLELDNGDRIAADMVVAGVGVRPNTDLAEAAGLVVDDGIVVDAHCRTSDPAIYAAGDVTRQYNPLLGRAVRLESWHNANVQAEIAGRAMAGLFDTPAEVPWVWSDQGSLNLQMAGFPDQVDQVVIRGDPLGEDGISVFQLNRGQLVGGLTANRGKDMAIIRRLLAAGGALDQDARMLADESVPLRKFQQGR